MPAFMYECWGTRAGKTPSSRTNDGAYISSMGSGASEVGMVHNKIVIMLADSVEKRMAEQSGSDTPLNTHE